MTTIKELKSSYASGEITIEEFRNQLLEIRRTKKMATHPEQRPYHIATTYDLLYDKESIIEYFGHFIEDEGLKDFITDTLTNKVPDYFWTLPSSSSGKYHPVDERGMFGLVLHTLRVFKVSNMLCIFSDVKGRDRDIVLIAAILHDSLKYDVPPGGVHTIQNHKTVACKYLELPDDICSVINATHIDPYIVKELDEKQRVLYYADAIASRDWIDIDITEKDIRVRA